MAGKLTPWASAAIMLAAALSPAAAQEPADPKPQSPPPEPRRPGLFRDGEHHRPKPSPEDVEKFKNVRKALEALTPEQRQRFQENFQRWANLSTEEKKALSDRNAFRRRKMAEDIDAAIKEAGLNLDPARRELFARRYGEERHLIEDRLRKEMDEKRHPLLREVIAKLKAEFAPAASPGKPPEVPAPTAP